MAARILLTFSLIWLAFSVQGASHNLTQKLAASRKDQISKVSYAVELDFVENRNFSGKVKIKLNLSHTARPLVIDAEVDQVDKVLVNRKKISDYDHKNGVLVVPAKHLSSKVTVEISFKTQMKAPAVTWYTDPQDGKSYFYTNLEPFGLNTVFPCFDQPDLKATFGLQVRGPKEWTFISNEPSGSKSIQGDQVVLTFPETLAISPYLFFIGGGSYIEFSDNYNGLPLKIYARASMKGMVDAKKIFELTKRGLKFFEDYFSYPYPFSKYDHVFVPDFGASGMENPGAITINERFLLGDHATQSQFHARENLIYHEMAHIWFGDLVTMKWWDDLWLNESFATFMASLAQEKIFNDPNRWLNFESTRIWTRRTDEKSTTHPIVNDVPDLVTAESSFDGITYGKGAAALKQLFFFAGEDAFKKGLQNYFKKFAFQNTELKDFIESIDSISPKNLKLWSRRWLLTRGLNRVSVNLSCKDGLVSGFEVMQKATVTGQETPHKTLFGFYNITNGKLKLTKNVLLTYAGQKASFSEHLTKTRCPDFIMPNQGGHDYGLFLLDHNSKKYIQKALVELPALDRMQIWTILEQEVKDGKLTPKMFFKLALHGLRHETHPTILALLQGIHNSSMNVLKIPFYNYLTPEERKKISLEFEPVLLDRLNKAADFSDEKLELFKLYLIFAQGPQSSERLASLISGKTKLKGLTLPQELRWDIVQKLAYNKHPNAKEFIQIQRNADPTFTGFVMEKASFSALPDPKEKNELWTTLLRAGMPYTALVRSAEFIYHPDNTSQNSELIKSYFKAMENMDWDAMISLVYFYLTKLFPQVSCSEDVLKLSEESFKKARLNSFARRSWIESNEQLRECIKIRKQSASSY